MTAIAVFTVGSTTHLISDSLATQLGTLAVADETQLSTGLILDSVDQRDAQFREEALKIGVIDPNIAIGFAGNENEANKVMSALRENAPFQDFPMFRNFFLQHVVPTITPGQEGLELCGFMVDGECTVKFRYNSTDDLDHTEDPFATYLCGKGANVFVEALTRIREDGEEPIGPGMEFSMVAQAFWVKEFLGNKEHVLSGYSGGAIAGLYADNGEIFWQGSRALIIVVNVGETGTSARFERLSVIHKTWSQKGNFFSSAAFLDPNDRQIQKVTQFSNSLSDPVSFDRDHLLPEMLTFEAEAMTIILLPRGFQPVHIGLLDLSKKEGSQVSFFDEEIGDGRLLKFRVSPVVLETLANNVIVEDDGFLEMPRLHSDIFDLLGVVEFIPRAIIVHFECGEEHRRFFCCKGSLKEQFRPPDSDSQLTYIDMIGAFLSENENKPQPNPQIKAILVPVEYITSVELGYRIKRFDPPQPIPGLLVYPDFTKPETSLDLSVLRDAMKELDKPGDYERKWDRLVGPGEM